MFYFMMGCGLGAYFMSLYYTHDKDIGKVVEHAQRDSVFWVQRIKELCQSRGGKEFWLSNCFNRGVFLLTFIR
jgi:hypothetical protein